MSQYCNSNYAVNRWSLWVFGYISYNSPFAKKGTLQIRKSPKHGTIKNRHRISSHEHGPRQPKSISNLERCSFWILWKHAVFLYVCSRNPQKSNRAYSIDNESVWYGGQSCLSEVLGYDDVSRRASSTVQPTDNMHKRSKPKRRRVPTTRSAWKRQHDERVDLSSL